MCKHKCNMNFSCVNDGICQYFAPTSYNIEECVFNVANMCTHYDAMIDLIYEKFSKINNNVKKTLKQRMGFISS